MQGEFVIIEDFSPGYITKIDPSQIGGSAAQAGQNVTITSGKLLRVRTPFSQFGTADSSGNAVLSSANFKTRTGLEIPMKSSDDTMYYYHEGTEAYEVLRTGYAVSPFGFAPFQENDEFVDKMMFGNGIDPLSSWNGVYTQLDGAITSGDGTIQVDSVLTDEVIYSGTASSVTTTTIDIATSDWATDLYNDYYVRITSGANQGDIALISDTTATQITFGTISGLSGTPTFEIRENKFAASGTIVVDGTDVTYTGFSDEKTFSGCSGTPTAADNAAVTQAPTEYPSAPRGNIMTANNGALYIAQYKSPSLWRSALFDPTDFTFSATRVAGEGDLIDFVEGGGAINGIGVQEDKVYVLKEDVQKVVSYTTEDVAVVETILEAPAVGTRSFQSVFKADNYLLHTSPIGGIKQVGRVADLDSTVRSFQLSDPIRPTVNSLNYDDSAAIFFDDKAYIAAKQEGSLFNDIVLVYNFLEGAWEVPYIGINARSWFIYKDELYFGSSLNNETFKFDEEASGDSNLTGDLPITASWTGGNINFGKPAELKHFQMLYVEGIISKDTTLTVKVNFEYNGYESVVQGTISGTDTQYLLSPIGPGGLGTEPLGTEPLGASGTEEEEIDEPSRFRVYFTLPEFPFYEASVTFESDGVAQDWGILRYGMNAEMQNQPYKPSLTKKLT